MAIPRSKAIQLLSKTEQRFYEASRRGAVDDHGATRLKKLIAGARNARDKARTRLHDQKRDGRGKSLAPKGNGRSTREAAPENSQLKVAVFEDILERFEKALKRAEARDQPNKPAPRAAVAKRATRRSAKKEASAAPAPAKKAKTRRGAKKKATGQAKARKKSTGKKKVSKKALKKAVQKAKVTARARSAAAPVGAERVRKNQQAAARTRVAHSAARGRRQQAKRDRR